MLTVARIVRRLLAGLLLLICLGVLLPPATPARAQSAPPPPPAPRPSADGGWEVPLETLGYGEALRLNGQVAQRDLFLPIPDGAGPGELRARALLAPDVTSASLEVRSGARVLATYTLTETTDLRIPLERATPSEGQLALTIVARLRSLDDICTTALIGGWLDLQDPTLTLTGQPLPPTSVATFFPPIAARVTLLVPPDPTPAESEAALRLGATVTRRYREQAPQIELDYLASRTALPPAAPASPFERQIVIREEGADALSLLVSPNGWASLSLGGGAEDLDRQSKFLADQLAPLAIGQQVRVLSIESAEQLGSQRRTFEQLGLTSLQVTGIGRMELPFAIAQADLGGPVRDVAVRLSGAYTPPSPDANATLSLLVNGTLIRAQPLDQSGVFDLDVSVPAGLVERDNTLVARFDYTPPQGLCRIGVHPFTGQIAAESYLHFQSGQALPGGFARFPQTLAPSFVAAIERNDQASLDATFDLVLLLQSLSRPPLSFELVAWQDAIAAKSAALLVAASPLSAATLGPQIEAVPMRVTDPDGREQLRIEVGTPYAALQAFVHDERDVLLLTGEGSMDLRPQLTAAIRADPLGWYALRGDTALVTDREEVTTLRLRDAALRAEPLAPASPAVNLLPLAYIAALVLVIGFLAWAYPRVVRPAVKP